MNNMSNYKEWKHEFLSRVAMFMPRISLYRSGIIKQLEYTIPSSDNQTYSVRMGWHKSGNKHYAEYTIDKTLHDLVFHGPNKIAALTCWHYNGNKSLECYFTNGKYNNTIRFPSGEELPARMSWYSNGIKTWEENFVNGEYNNPASGKPAYTLWDIYGNIVSEKWYVNGLLV